MKHNELILQVPKYQDQYTESHESARQKRYDPQKSRKDYPGPIIKKDDVYYGGVFCGNIEQSTDEVNDMSRQSEEDLGKKSLRENKAQKPSTQQHQTHNNENLIKSIQKAIKLLILRTSTISLLLCIFLFIVMFGQVS